ncbi:MAG: sigma-70 family RNA polymerase sigma factor [Candidatus Fervidibacter sp.]|uniref:sigma-70 family RNA polymerase sigma factor n=1 Tax=Candidatus Fervidibacter sp. TaxID=3100871 RepID=UPI0040495AF9
MQKLEIVKQALRQARRWHCPPHWHPNDWREELIAVAWAALWEGLNNGIGSEDELRKFIIAALMKRYRDEWNYGTRWVQSNNQQKNDKDGESETGWDSWDWAETETDFESDEQEINWLRMIVRQALSQLTDEDRYILERKFWDGASERELAKELGISQPAIHKRLKRIYEQLKTILS